MARQGWITVIRILLFLINSHSESHMNIASSWNELQSYQDTVNTIISTSLSQDYRHELYRDLVTFVDMFGPRPLGSDSLERSIEYIYNNLKKEGFSHVRMEPVMVPRWQVFVSGILSEVVVVQDFRELNSKAEQVRGKIVLVNYNYTQYSMSKYYRDKSPSKVAQLGAIAVLIRSATPFSLYTPHTGWVSYEQDIPKIPAACITTEDADMLTRMARAGHNVTVLLVVRTKEVEPGISYNIAAEITGDTHPEEVVIFGGHLDTMYVGLGASDDASGVFVTWQAMRTLRRLNLRPRRTIRAVFWTAEEAHVLGGSAYFHSHKDELDRISLVMEADQGTFQPVGLMFQGSQEAQVIMTEVVQLMSRVGATSLIPTNIPYGDTKMFGDAGVPTAVLTTEDHKYFHSHHTNADTPGVLNPDQLDSCGAFWASVAYVVADLIRLLPRPNVQLVP